jgi:hypothetical protein
LSVSGWRIGPEDVGHGIKVVLCIPLAHVRLEPVALTEKGWVDPASSHHLGEEFIDVLKDKNVLVLRLNRSRLPGPRRRRKTMVVENPKGKPP